MKLLVQHCSLRSAQCTDDEPRKDDPAGIGVGYRDMVIRARQVG